MRFLRSHRPVMLAAGLSLAAMQPAAAAGNLTLPFADPNPRVTSWTDHHYPDRQEDGIMIRFDGATGYAYDGHRGTDYAVPANTPVVAADDGTVIYSEWSDSGGWGVVIDHAEDRTAYFHNNRLFVYPGQHVSRGQLIALSGSTGNSTGPHVHFEVRDLMTPWHSIDPYGWTGSGQDPWRWDLGNLWRNNRPTPFLLPLAFFGGAHWNFWYGADGPPPPVSWQLRDGGRGLAGFAVRWDADPGPSAARKLGLSGTATVPGPGSHTLHLRVFDRAGDSADITYLYTYDVDPPTAELVAGSASSSALSLRWQGSDALSGIKDVAIDVAKGSAGFRPWFSQSAEQQEPGAQRGVVRFLGDPGTGYQFRLTVRDAARNAAPTAVVTTSIPGGAALPASAADRAVLGELPPQPDGSLPVMGLRQEHPATGGALALGADASLHGLGAAPLDPAVAPASTAVAVDVAVTASGSIRLLGDGSTWQADGTPGPRLALGSPVRLLAADDGSLLGFGADGAIADSKGARSRVGLSPGTVLVDAALFPGTRAGLALDSGGALHAFGGADPALAAFPGGWALPAQAGGLSLAGTPQAPAGLITDSRGDWQPIGSSLLLPDPFFGGPAFDPSTGLPIR